MFHHILAASTPMCCLEENQPRTQRVVERDVLTGEAPTFVRHAFPSKMVEKWAISMGKFDHDLSVLPKPGIMVSKGNQPLLWPNISG